MEKQWICEGKHFSATDTIIAVNVIKYIFCSFYGFYGLDVIAAFGFGIDMDSQKENDHPFVKNASLMFDPEQYAGIGLLIFGETFLRVSTK